MKALCWYGKYDVRVEDVPEPKILNPRDAGFFRERGGQSNPTVSTGLRGYWENRFSVR